MFFQASSRDKAFANRIVTEFCKLAMPDNFSTKQEELGGVGMILGWLDALLNHFTTQKARLKAMQKVLQTQGEAQDNTIAFAGATAMTTIILCLDESSGHQYQKYRQYVIDSIRTAVSDLQERKAGLEQQLSKIDSPCALPNESPTPAL